MTVSNVAFSVSALVCSSLRVNRICVEVWLLTYYYYSFSLLHCRFSFLKTSKLCILLKTSCIHTQAHSHAANSDSTHCAQEEFRLLQCSQDDWLPCKCMCHHPPVTGPNRHHYQRHVLAFHAAVD